ncbi:Putative C2H2-type Zinc finger protein [Emiliania huxleyi virus 99B1]|nr:hypothetical protein EhVM1_000190 [Emiliania huxleyi virus M1]CAZ69511.1 Putative C2H2-type Zinc finger protein [Emiliania huxleyi virus 99B1]
MSENKAKRHKTLYSCGYDGCTYFTFRKNDMELHTRRHMGEKPYKCDVLDCNAAFAKSCDLTTHKRTHTGEKPYKCDMLNCNAAFSDQSNLKKHKIIHMGEKPYKCDFLNCNAAFSQLWNLVTHKRTHTGEKPYKCEFLNCNAAFAKSCDLKRHARIHTGEKPYACDICGSAFADPSGYRVHKNRCLGIKPYACDICDYASAAKSDLNDHVRVRHNDQYIARRKIQEEKVNKLLTESGYVQLYNLGDALPPPGNYKREHKINFDCGSNNKQSSHCFIDFIINSNGTYIFLEVDENQHRFGYDAMLSCDCKRMTDVQATVIQSDDRIPPIYWLRYNPQAWHCNEETIRVPTEVRQRFLMERINEVQPSESIRIEYMFYDIVDDELEVITNEEYADCFRPLAFQLTSPEKFGVVFCQECN